MSLLRRRAAFSASTLEKSSIENFADGKSVGADVGDLFIDIGIEAFDQRDHDDHRRHAEDDTEQRQKRPQLMPENRGERQFDCFEKRHVEPREN